MALKCIFAKSIYPPGHGRIGGHYIHTGCPYVRVRTSVTKTTYTMHENNDHLLAGAWWVTLKSSDLF